MKNLTEKNVGVSCGEWKVSDSARRTNPPWPCSSPDERQATDLWLEDREGIRPKVHISSHSSQPFSPSPACSSEVISSHKHPACEETSRYFPALLCVSLTHTHRIYPDKLPLVLTASPLPGSLPEISLPHPFAQPLLYYKGWLPCLSPPPYQLPNILSAFWHIQDAQSMFGTRFLKMIKCINTERGVPTP